jgi:hypothetical protein
VLCSSQTYSGFGDLLELSHDSSDLPNYFGIATIAKLLLQVEMLCVKVHDQSPVFDAARTAQVSSVTLEHDI